MEKKYADIINEGKKNGKKLSEINAELKAAGATFHLDYTMTSDGPQVGWSEKEMAEGFIPAEEEPKDAQRTVDMKRRPEFAGTARLQHVPGGTYEVTYNELGYAVKAVRIHG